MIHHFWGVKGGGQPRIDEQNQSVLGRAPVEPVYFVLRAEVTAEVHVCASWSVFPKAAAPVVDDDSDLATSLGGAPMAPIRF